MGISVKLDDHTLSDMHGRPEFSFVLSDSDGGAEICALKPLRYSVVKQLHDALKESRILARLDCQGAPFPPAYHFSDMTTTANRHLRSDELGNYYRTLFNSRAAYSDPSAYEVMCDSVRDCQTRPLALPRAGGWGGRGSRGRARA